MRLETYSWLAVVLGIACAAINWLGLAGWMAALVILVSIGAHVAGNALGTRLREATDRDLASRRRMPRPIAAVPAAAPTHLVAGQGAQGGDVGLGLQQLPELLGTPLCQGVLDLDRAAQAGHILQQGSAPASLVRVP